MKKDIALAHFVEFRGEKCLQCSINRNLIPAYIEEILQLSICKSLVPMGFLNEDSLVYYDLNNGMKIEEITREWKKEGLNISLKLLDSITILINTIFEIENYLFTGKGFHINWDTIYFSPKDKTIKLAYFPEIDDGCSMSQKILALIADSEDLIGDEEWAYNTKHLLKIISKEDSLNEVLAKIINFAREISGRDWPDLSSLRQL